MQREYRLAKREHFQLVYKRGKSAANHQFVVYYLLRPETEHFRLGISVSKKVGNAVVRNRMKRVIKEIVRLNADALIEHIDVVLIVRKPAVTMEYGELQRSILHVLKRAELLKKGKRNSPV